MNIKNLTEGLIIRNYKELCKILEIKITGGYSKKAQFKELSCYCKYTKEGHKFIIQEIYKTPKKKIDNRYNNHSNRIYYDAFKPNEENGEKTGVYCIIRNNNIYIGSTVRSFRDRFQEHNMPSRIDNKETFQILNNDGCFDILWIANKNTTEQQIREKEAEYINKFKNNKNWILINKNKNTWSFIPKNKPKRKNKYIKINSNNYEKAIKILKENNLMK
ncbi:phage-related protein [Clostridium botulinum B str. Osaka05]|uniref:Phage-related protein n=1 Tax=Clostridium botulinum B str. Osaka05 TaxID=1407017 RepID=A0A060N9L1_CLOBO|nr:GIY-YIG nuclease family protein [Clostridium botulinum]BAO04944.1 phage-related protein [Clostridium botulinum B str. Osaka05]